LTYYPLCFWIYSVFLLWENMLFKALRSSLSSIHTHLPLPRFGRLHGFASQGLRLQVRRSTYPILHFWHSSTCSCSGLRSAQIRHCIPPPHGLLQDDQSKNSPCLETAITIKKREFIKFVTQCTYVWIDVLLHARLTDRQGIGHIGHCGPQNEFKFLFPWPNIDKIWKSYFW
jgi:hypothetical protein